MLTIARTCSNRIITRALQTDGRPLVALLRQGADDCEPCADGAQLQRLIDSDATAMIVHNQHAAAVAQIEALDVTPERVFIEIRQDTRGVLGLQAYRNGDKTPEALELLHE